MLLTIAKLLALLLAILVISKSYVSFRHRQDSRTMFLFWTITWLAIIWAAFSPDTINNFLGSRKVGVGSFLAIVLVFVYFVIYRIYVKADRIEKELHRIVRELSLRDVSLPTKTKKKSRKE